MILRTLSGLTAAAFDDRALAAAVRPRLRGLPRRVFEAGWDWGRDWVPPGERGEPLAAAGRLLGATLFADPGPHGRLRRRELANKLRAYRQVRHPAAGLGLEGGALDLVAAVERAYRRPAWEVLWRVEGLAHDWAIERLDDGREPSLAAPELATLPAPSVLGVHAGLGLALAERALGDLPPSAGPAEAAAVLDRLEADARRLSRPAHVDTTLEPLGIVARCFFPERIPAVVRGLDHGLVHRGSRLAAFWWHGVGRGLYFAPVGFVPGWSSIAAALALARREAPAGPPRADATSGVAYAATMVNLRDPAVVAAYLAAPEEDAAPDEPFAAGVLAALVLRDDATPDDPEVAAFVAHEPAHRVAARRWREHVRDPAAGALAAGRQHRRSGNAGRDWYRRIGPESGRENRREDRR